MDTDISIDDIINGVSKREFELRFAPQIDLAKGKVTGMATNLIWAKNGYESLTKSSILGILDRHNKRIGFFLYYLVQALKAHSALRRTGHQFPISIALRPSELASDGFFHAVTQVFTDSGASAKDIILQLPPTVLDDFYNHLGTLGKLIDFGFKISIRDFYQDPDSLNKVSRKLIHEVITPPALGRRLSTNPKTQQNLSKLLNSTSEQDWRCVIDGITTRACLDAAKAQGASNVQGEYFGESLSLAAIHQLLLAHKAED